MPPFFLAAPGWGNGEMGNWGGGVLGKWGDEVMGIRLHDCMGISLPNIPLFQLRNEMELSSNQKR